MGNSVPSDPTSPLPPPPNPNGGLDVMTCQQATRQIERLIEDGELKDIERALLFNHIRACPACKAELQKHRQLELRLKETFAPLDTRPDFNQRLLAALPDMDYKPKIEVMPSSDTVARGTSRYQQISARVSAQMPKLRWFYRWRTVLGVAACILLGLAGVALRFATVHDADRPPSVLELSGKAHIKHHDKQMSTLASERMLSPGDVLTADVPNTDFECWLAFGEAHLAHVNLSSGAELSADNRHVYTLKTGSAHFDVEKNRPKGPDELFEVRIAESGSVRVRGTSFDIKNAGTMSATVAVQEGHVEVQCGSALSELNAGEQVALGPGGFSGPVTAVAVASAPAPAPQPNLAQGQGGAQIVGIKVEPGPVKPPSIAQVDDAAFDWDTRVGPLNLNGKTLAEGIDALSQHLASPHALTVLAQMARGRLVAQDNRLTFSVWHPMPVRSVLAWMARDVGARFDVDADGRGTLRVTAPDELPGHPESGALPPEVRDALEKPLQGAMRVDGAARKATLAATLNDLAWRCGVTIIAEHVDAPLNLNIESPRAQGRTAARQLDEILGSAHLCAAWYDNVLYVAPAPRLEALTTVERHSKPISVLVGLPEQPAWGQNLLWLLSEHAALPGQLPRLLPGLPLSSTVPGYWDVDPLLVGRAAFAKLSIVETNDGPVLSYRAGMLGDLHLNVLLSEFERGSPQVHGASGLTHVLPSVVIKDTNQLIELAKPFMPVESRVKNLPFNHQALAVRNLPLGRALEWGAWLHGCGIASGTNGLVIDELMLCYGAPAPQVLPLVPAAEHSLELSAQLPDTFAKLLPRLYPTMFANVEFKPLAGRLAFLGDKRQLQLAQELFHAFEQDLNAAPAAADTGERKLDFATWLPSWRRALEQNLAEPFKGDGSGTVTGTFAGLLRQSGIGTQLRHTVLVDLLGMQQNHNTNINALDVSQLTIGQYLEALARAADMTVVLEGEVIVLKPAR